MSPFQKDDGGQEFCGARDLISKMGRPRTLTCAKPRGHQGAHGSWSEHWTTWRDGERYTMPAPDHRNVRQIRERVRVLEEALRAGEREASKTWEPNEGGMTIGRLPPNTNAWRRWIKRARALLSPAAATEGGEGA